MYSSRPVEGEGGDGRVVKLGSAKTGVEDDLEFYACGISLVSHPHSPRAPTVHFNYRHFEAYDRSNPSHPRLACWFGGCFDLAPTFLNKDDTRHFRGLLKWAHDQHDSTCHPRFQKFCDGYFDIPHRRKARGVVGIFFDDLEPTSTSSSPGSPGSSGSGAKSGDDLFQFVRSCGDTFIPSYYPLVQKNMQRPYIQAMKEWQQLRRGRYAEFNLVYDRGTKFGFQTKGGNTEAILMSLPLTARWEYKKKVEVGSKEDRIQKVLREPREWV